MKMETKKQIKDLEKNLKQKVDFKPIKSPIKRLNYFWKDKDGKEISYDEFKTRFKQGVEGVTQLQQTTMQIKSTWIIIIGILCGIVVSLFAWRTLWWLEIILIGALFNTSMQLLGLWQKKIQLKMMEDSLK